MTIIRWGLGTNLCFSGSAAHGDYVFGWEGDTLQKAMDKGCTLNKDCAAAGLQAQTPAQYNACTNKQLAPEDVDDCKCHDTLSTIQRRELMLTCVIGLAELPIGRMAVKGRA